MATYGIDYYGTTFYGSSAITQFSAGNFLATPIDYGVIQLTWGAPTGAWDYIRLLRSPYGFAVNADDGDLLLEVANPGPTLYFDRGQTPNSVGLTGGKCYYYTLLVHGTALNKWQVAGTAVGISVKNYLTNDLMYQYLPEVLRANIPADDALDSTNDFLYRFIKLFAFSLDLYKTQADNVMSRYDVANLDGRLIPTFMQNFNIPYEPSIGIKQSRIFLKNISLLLQDKGTKKGLNEFIKAYGGYDSVITMGKNLMLDQNDCSFEQTIGNWASVSNATLVRYPSTSLPSIPPYSEIAAQANFPNLQGAVLKVTSVATANTVLALTGTSTVQYGVPVKGATAYVLTAYARAAATARAISAQIFWYDNFGKFISSSTGSTTNDAVGSWTRVTTVVAASAVPTNAVFAVPQLTIASTVAGEIHYFDAIQFEQDATRTNIFPYPSSEDGTTNGGSSYTGANRSVVISNSTDVAYSGTKSLKYLAGTGKDLTSLRSWFLYGSPTTTPLIPLVPFTISEWVYSPVAVTVQPSGDIFNASSTYLTTVAGGTFSIPAGVWTRVFMTFTPPANSTFISPAIRDNPSSPFPFRENLCTNPNGVTGSTMYAPYNVSTITAVADVAALFQGYYISVAVSTGLGFCGIIGQTAPYVPAGSLVQISTYIKGTSGKVVNFSGRPTNAGGSYLGEGLGVVSATLTGNWQRITTSYSYGSAASYPGFQIYTDTSLGATTFYIGGTLIEVSSSLGTYFDGSTGGAYQRWSGTANASSSIDSPPLYIDAVLLEQSATLGTYFDGSTASDAAYNYSWSGTANSSSSTAAHSYQDARQIQAVLVANRINSLINPNCEGSASIGWSATNGTLALNAAHISSTTTAPSVPLSTGSIKLTATAVGTTTLASSSMPIFSGNTYTFSIYSETTDAGAKYPLTPYVSWYNGSSALIATTTGTPVSSNSAWNQVSVSSTAPSTAVTAVAGFTWNVSAMPSIANWQDIAYGNSRFVAVAYGSSIAATSPDGITWTARSLPSSDNWNDIAFGNGVFVTIAQNSTAVAVSSDGITWTSSTLPVSQFWTSITFGNGKFVAVSQASSVAATSPDGITWTARTMPSSQSWLDVAYGNSTFVAIAQYSSIAATSPDGITWTAWTMPSTSPWEAIEFGNSTFVAVAYGTSAAATSPDGITWTARTMPAGSTNWNSIAYGNSTFVAVAYGSSVAATSPDGITWTARTLPSSNGWLCTSYGSGKFVTLAYGTSAAATSPDGITWAALGIGNSVLIDAGLFEKSAFVGSYFDGSNGLAELADLFWEGGTANQGRSHYYKNRFAVQSRLVSKIPSWINYGSTFELFLAQAGT